MVSSELDTAIRQRSELAGHGIPIEGHGVNLPSPAPPCQNAFKPGIRKSTHSLGTRTAPDRFDSRGTFLPIPSPTWNMESAGG